MSLPVVLTPEAQAEFDAAADWYEQRAGLGLAFTAAVREVLNRIAAMPLIHQVVYKDIRRGVVRRFPYSVFYRVEPDRLRSLRCSTIGRTQRFGRAAPNPPTRLTTSE